MIDKEVFAAELKSLSNWFDKALNKESLGRLYLILSAELTTEEFKQGLFWAYRDLNPHPSFFPSPKQLIEAVHGTVEDRAYLQWANLDRLSVVGRQAYNEIGGSYAVNNSSEPTYLRREFVKFYKAFAKNSNPADLRMPPASAAIAPRQTESPTEATVIEDNLTIDEKAEQILQGRRTRLHSFWMLGCLLPEKRTEAINEAASLGYVVSDTGITLPTGETYSRLKEQAIAELLAESGIKL